jgi:hypothetical protein
MKNRSDQDKKIAKLMFWVLTPVLLPTCIRFYWIIFNYLYGLVIIVIIGDKHAGMITTAALVTSLVFGVVTYSVLYQQYKKYIIGN